jgi:hypothetical protein
MPPATGQFMLVVVSLSMVATPLVATLARRLGARLLDRDANGKGSEPDGEISGPGESAGLCANVC